MKREISKGHGVFLGLVLLLAGHASQAGIINGDFVSDLSGWTIGGGGPDPTAQVSWQSTSGNGYAELASSTWQLNPLGVFLEQQFTVEAGLTELVADIGLLGTTTDTTGDSLPPGFDALVVQVQSGGTTADAALYRQFDGIFVDTAGIGVEAIALVGSIFDFQVVADLSAFVGELVTLQFVLTPQPDGLATVFGIDNVALRAASVSPPPNPNPMPLPSTLSLLAAAWLIRARGAARV